MNEMNELPPDMIERKTVASAPLDHLDYFVEWGGRSWTSLTRAAVCECIGVERLRGARVLEIGTRYGKMAVLFALLGAEVTAIELDAFKHHLRSAREEAEKFGVADQICFESYDGNLDNYDDGTYDVVFTKSVLVVVPDLPPFLRRLKKKLKDDGTAVFLENGRGGILTRTLRRLRHRRWNWKTARYFGDDDMTQFRDCFEFCSVRKTHLPPVYLIHGEKRQEVERKV